LTSVRWSQTKFAEADVNRDRKREKCFEQFLPKTLRYVNSVGISFSKPTGLRPADAGQQKASHRGVTPDCAFWAFFAQNAVSKKLRLHKLEIRIPH
jgi:hypothetical protein